MKVLFLIPPSEGKCVGWTHNAEQISYVLKKPLGIAEKATKTDLKCKDARYVEARSLNASLEQWPFTEAIRRYSGVMYGAIDYFSMTKESQVFFAEHFLVLSGMYGIVRPKDIIGNYKLPIETKWLGAYWKKTITAAIEKSGAHYIVNLLPLSYMKMIDLGALSIPVIHIQFIEEKWVEIRKMAHGVKKVRGEWIRKICDAGIVDYRSFWGMREIQGKDTYISILSEKTR